MRRNTRSILILLIFVSMLLSSCSAAGVASGQAQPTTEATTPGASTNSGAATADLSSPQGVLAAFSSLMASIPAGKGYGYIQADALKADLAFPEKPFLVDVRDSSEVQASGYIEGAVNIPLRTLLNNLDKLPAQNANIVIYSKSGYRSGMALAALMLLGYTNVHDLAGGFSSWVNASQNAIVSSGSPADPPVLTMNPVIVNQATFDTLNNFLSNLPDNFYQVDAISLSTQLTSSNPPTLIDMNTASDHQQYGHIAGAIFIGFSDFFNHLDQLPSKDTPMVIYAVGGGHSSIIVMGLRMMGYTNVVSLQGGILGWKGANLPLQPGGAN